MAKTPEAKHAEDILSVLLDHIPGIAVEGYGPDGKILFWNKAAEKIYGYTAEEAVGQDLGTCIVPEDVKPLWGKAMEAGAAVKDTGEFLPPGELVLKRKDGSPVEVYSIHCAVKKENEDPVLFCIDVDLTERKKIEKTLKEKLDEVEKLNELMADREMKMIELKKEIEELKKK
ncbi:MAG: PAS domain S-box protein [Patescibacteria group bacterium]